MNVLAIADRRPKIDIQDVVRQNNIEREQPKVLLHGHVYPTEENVVKQHGPTRIEYVYEYKVVIL